MKTKFQTILYPAIFMLLMLAQNPAQAADFRCTQGELDTCQPYLLRMLECSGAGEYSDGQLKGCCLAVRAAPEIYTGFCRCATNYSCGEIQQMCVDAGKDGGLPPGVESESAEERAAGTAEGTYYEADDSMGGCSAAPEPKFGILWLVFSWLGLYLLGVHRKFYTEK